MDLETEVKELRKQLLVETIRRLSSEMNAAQATMAACNMRIPMIENELATMKARLKELTKDEPDGPTSH